jgi:hypothetical protein
MSRITPIETLPILNRTDDVRLPDAVTINYGPIGLLSHFFLAADQHVRERGIRLKIRHDMEELLWLNRREVALGNWYPLLPPFNCEMNELTPENSYWISGVDAAGETVVAQSAVLYPWFESSLADHMREMLYPDPDTAPASTIDCEMAHRIRGMVYFGGSTWVHPSARRLGLGMAMPRISKAYGAAVWGAEWSVAFIKRDQIEIGMHKAYGYTQAAFGLNFPGTPIGDLDIGLAYQSSLELMAQVERFVAERSAGSNATAARDIAA